MVGGVEMEVVGERVAGSDGEVVFAALRVGTSEDVSESVGEKAECVSVAVGAGVTELEVEELRSCEDVAG